MKQPTFVALAVVLCICLHSAYSQNFVSISTNTTSISERGGASTIAIVQTSTTATTVVGFSVGGTAVLGKDYNVILGNPGTDTYTSTIGGSVRLTGATPRATITLVAIDNLLVDGDRTVVLTLGTDPLYTISGSASLTTTIVNDDFNNVTLSAIGATTISEGTNGAFVFQFTRYGNVSLALPVAINIGGTALIYSRYNFTAASPIAVSSDNRTATVTFAAGVSQVNVTAPVIDDTIGQQPETIVLTIQTGALYIPIAPDFAVVTILSNDPDSVSLSVSPTSALSASGTAMVFTARRAGSVGTAALSVNYTLTGTAVRNTDYTYSGPALTAFQGTLNFASTEAALTFSVTPVAFSTVQLDKTVVGTILAPLASSGQNFTVLPNQGVATATIVNDLSAVSVAVSPNSQGLNSGQKFVFTFTRSGYLANAITVPFTISGTAVLGSDYTVTGASAISTTDGTVSIAAGSNNATLTISIVASSVIAADKSFTFTVKQGTGFLVGSPSTATATIVNDNRYPVSLFASPTSLSQDSTSSFVVTFSAIGNIATPLQLVFNVGGTAVLNQHYTVSGALFSGPQGVVAMAAATNPSVSFQIRPLPNAVPGVPSTIVLTLVQGVGYTPSGVASVTLSIINLPLPDNTVSMTLANPSVEQNSNQPLVYSFVRSGPVASSLLVRFNVSGTAVFGTDYRVSGADSFSINTGSFTFPVGSSNAAVSVYPLVTLNFGTTKTVSFSLFQSSTYLVNSMANSATGSITDAGIVTIDTLQPPSTAITGFAIVELRFSNQVRLSVPIMRVEISNLLRLPSQFVDIVENKYNNVVVKLFDLPNSVSGATLARQLLLLVNTPDPAVIGLSIYPSMAMALNNIYLNQATLTLRPAPITVPPPAKGGGNGNGIGGKGFYYYYRPVIIINAADSLRPFAAFVMAIVMIAVTAVVAL
jgi:hypothetical protein